MYKLNDSCYSFENIFDDSLLTSHYSQNAHIGSYELVSELVTILSHFGTKLTEDITDKQKLIENENIDCLRILNTNVDLAISNLNKFREKCQNIVKNEVSSAERYLIQLRNEVKTQQSEYYRLILSPTEQCASRYHIKKVLEYVEKLVNIITRLNSIMPIISISVPTENIDNILNFRFSLLNNKQLLNKEQKQTKTRQRGKVPTLSIVQSFVNTNSLDLTNISSLNQIHSTDSTFNSSTTSLSCLSIISNVDVTKYKFGQLIRTKYITYLIATDGQNVLCYNNDANYINFVSLTGYFLSNYKWPTARIIDVCWCPLIDQYLIATRFAIFQFQCTIVSNPAAVKLCFELNECEFVRIACNKLSIFVYTVHHRHSVLQVYDSNFNLTKIFDSLTQRLPVGIHSFCCTNSLIGLTIKKEHLGMIDDHHYYHPYTNPNSISLLLFDIETLELYRKIDLTDCEDVTSMKCLESSNVFFILGQTKKLWIIKVVDNNDVEIIHRIHLYTDQTQLCVLNKKDLLLINSGCFGIQVLKYRP